MRTRWIAVALFYLGAMMLAASSAGAAAPTPAWKLSLSSVPTNFDPGFTPDPNLGTPQYLIVAANVGGASTSGQITITDTLPAGLTALPGIGGGGSDEAAAKVECGSLGQTITCTTEGPIHPGRLVEVKIPVEVEPSAPAFLTDEASIAGGGAGEAKASTTTTVDPLPAPFGFLAGDTGFSAPLSEADGSAATEAGSHPYQLTVDLGFPITQVEGGYISVADGGLRDAGSDLPRGLIVDPAATSALCTEVQLTASPEGCPRGSQIGIATVLTTVLSPLPQVSNLYNMVPPPGAASSFGFNVGGLGVYAHVIGSVRSDGDFGLSGGATDILSLGKNPVLGIRLELWGEPASQSHDNVRDICTYSNFTAKLCPLPPEEDTGAALLTLPGDCPGHPLPFAAQADSWKEPGKFHHASYESADLEGNPVSVAGCNQLSFEPTIEAKPTTNLTDSPSGLDFRLHQPQESDFESLATASLEDATVTLPAGMAVNPASAQGRGACTREQIGLLTEVGQTPIHLSKQPAVCPDSSKVGTVDVSSPLVAQIDDESHKVARDPETGEAIPRPLEGSVYLAKPFDNPFGSLIAIYISVEDPKTGVVAKLAGKVTPDPSTGQLTTRFEENPELPLEDVEVHLFNGSRASLITPLSCGTHTTTSTLTPWSAPEGLDAHPMSSFAATATPSGAACPASDSQAPSAPDFHAGMVLPQAGAYSPFVFKLSRPDGSQRISGIDLTLPPGLTGKLAGIGTCSDAQIAQAQARSHPSEGVLEREQPSCPSSSEVGTVDVSAGAGPTPLNVTGHAYLAGPYKGAPLSMVIVTPAVAGPFDLGAVVVRAALYVNPESAQIHAVSDPLPQILEGIPLDVRSVSLQASRPNFTLNPTSCDPMQVLANASSALGAQSALKSPFQVGGCPQLPFKPKLSLRLKGGTKRAAHPKLIATLKARPGEANVARAQVKLPPSAFLDQAHIRTVCTRVQFAANACPAGSIYGKAQAITPLLDNPLSGNVYLRSSNHKLPDLVVALKGPASQPIEIDLAGKTDSVRGALRNTFEAVPDAPVSSFKLELFGGKRGLVVNSRNLCAHPYRAEVNLDGQNGKVFDTTPVVKSDCKGKGRKGRHGKGGR
jgi:hypothetical protein